MYVIRRRPGQWTEVTCLKSGHQLRITAERDENGRIRLVFDDPGQQFTIRREEVASRRTQAKQGA
jgi:hypothetical protein